MIDGSFFLLLGFIRTHFSTKLSFNTTGEKRSPFKTKFVGSCHSPGLELRRSLIPVSKKRSLPTLLLTQGLQQRLKAAARD